MSKKLSVLIVDDDVDLGDTLLDILDAKGYDVSFASSGTKALHKIEEKEYDVVLLDIRMPGMNGVETLKQVNVRSPLTTVVMITAFAHDDLINEAKEEGVLKILNKPLDIEKIISFLKNHEVLKTIFIVDDDTAFCESLKDTIALHGYDVTVVYTAQEAIDTFDNQEYGIILLDMKLNGKSGIDVAESIREKGYESAIVMMSAYKKKFQSLLENAGQECAFIEKPFEINSIIKLLDKVAKKKMLEVLK